MSAFKDLSGKTFGCWEVIKLSHITSSNHSYWVCKCNMCNNTHTVESSSLISGRSTKCRSCATTRAKKKSFSKDPIKKVFMGMKQRCYNKNTRSYSNYGAKGIAICDEWLTNPESFYQWAYNNGYSKGLSIERKDISKDYSPDNCIFIPKNEQSKNRSVSIMVTINDKTMCLSDWCKEYNISLSLVKYRTEKKGMTYEQALSLPVKKRTP